MYTNAYQIEDTSAVLELGTNQSSKDISIGGSTDTDRVVFNTTKLAEGEGAEEVVNADAGVIVEGGLVVRDVVIAKEFRGAGTGGGPGTILLWGGSTSVLPDRYLLCNGASLNTTTYNKLFEAIGYIHGGSGATFKLPDLRDKFIPGAGTSYAVAATGGANTVTLTETQMPLHNHALGVNNAPHNHGVSFNSGGANAPHTHPGSTGGGGNHNHPAGATRGGGTHNHPSGGSNNTGNHGHPYTRANGGGVEHGNRSNNAMRASFTGAGTGGAGAHSHSVSVNSTSSEHNHPVYVNSGDSAHNHPVSVGGANAPHSHSISGDFASANAPHGHPLGNTGGSDPIENRPPYYALCYIIQSE